MTGTREPLQDGGIQAMLRDSGLEGAAELGSTLAQLQAMVPDRAPAPRADLAAMLTAGGSSSAAAGSAAHPTSAVPAVTPAQGAIAGVLPCGVVSLGERRGRKRGLAILGGAVVGAMTLGAGAVAASSEDFRKNVSHTVGGIFQPAGPTPGVAPEPAAPSPADIPAPVVPANPAGNPALPPSVDAPEAPETPAAEPAKPGGAGTPAAEGRGGLLPLPPHRPVTPAVPGLPGTGESPTLPKAQLPGRVIPRVLPSLPGQP